MKKFLLFGWALLLGVLTMQAQDVTVVDNISDYTGDAAYVYSKADGKTYALNNLGSYELYGVYVKTNTLNIASPEAKNQVIEYIATDNDHKTYINTGYVHTTQTRVVADFEINEAADSYDGWRAVFGSRTGFAEKALVYFYHYDNSRRGCFTLGDRETKGANPGTNALDRGIRYILDANSVTKKVTVTPKEGATDENTSIIDNSDATPQDGQHPLFIFDLSTGSDGHADGSKARMKLYGFKIYEGDELVRDYEPIVTPEGKGGLHDKVTDTNLFSADDAVQFLLSPDAADKLQPGISVYPGKMVLNTTDGKVYKFDGTQFVLSGDGNRTLTEIASTDYKDLNNWVTNNDHMDIFSGKWQTTANGYKIDPYVGTSGHEPLMIQVPLEMGADYNYSFSASWGAYNSWHSVEMHAYVCNFWDLGTTESGTSVSGSVLATQTFPFDGGTDVPFSLDFTADRANQTLLFQFGDVDDGEKGFWFEFDNLSVKKYNYPEAYPSLNPYQQLLATLIAEVQATTLNTTTVLANNLSTALTDAQNVVDGDDLVEQKAKLEALQAAFDAAKAVDVTILSATVTLAKAAGINTADEDDFIENGTDNGVKENLLRILRAERKLNAAQKFKVDPAKVEGSEPADGEFYLLNVGTGLFLNTTADWGTHISIDNPGMVITLVQDGTGADGLAAFKISGNGWDGLNWTEEYWDKNGEHKSAFRPVEGKENVYYWNVFDNFDWHFVYDVKDGECDNGTQYWNAVQKRNRPTADYAEDLNAQWKLVTKAQLLAAMADASEESPIDATFLIENPNFTKFGGMDVARGWEGVGGVMTADRNPYYVVEYYQCDIDLKQTIEGLPAGKYQVSVSGLYRDGGGMQDSGRINEIDILENDETPESNAYLVAYTNEDNKQESPLPTATSEIGNLPGIGNVYKGIQIADNPQQANEYFQTGLYQTSVIVEVGEEGTLTIGIEDTNNGKAGNWVVVDNFRLTYLGPVTTVTATVTSEGFATFSSPYSLDFSATEIKAYKAVSVTEDKVTFESVEQVPAGTGVLLAAEGGKVEEIPVIDEAPAIEDNLLIGTLVETEIPEGSLVLTKKEGDDKLKFYRTAAGYKSAAGRAYLPPIGSANSLSISFIDDETTAISQIETATTDEPVYSVTGQRLAQPRKGINVMRGKKVIIK